jgi:hypothetical protein
MFRKYNHWYNDLTPLKQLTGFFIFYWCLWLISSLLGDKFFFDEQHSWGYHIFDATWMAFFMTICFNWPKLKAMFKRDSNAAKSAHN